MEWLTSIFHGVIREGKIPADWSLDLVIKILERVLEKIIRKGSHWMKCSLDFDLAEER